MASFPHQFATATHDPAHGSGANPGIAEPMFDGGPAWIDDGHYTVEPRRLQQSIAELQN